MKQLNNYRILFVFRILKTLLGLFLDSFLVLYFMTLSDSNILPFGVYKLISVTVLYLTIFFLRNKSKSKNRIYLLRTGIILYLLYFITIFILKEKIIEYIYIIGILYGLEDGFYFSVYNIFESDSINNNERARFNGNYKTISNLLSIIFPLICGSLIAVTDFNRAVILILFILCVMLLLSFGLKDNQITNDRKAHIKEYLKIVNQNKNLKSIYKTSIFSGLTYSSGAFLSIITIYIIRVCDNSMSLGVYTSVIALLIALVAYLFGNVIKKKDYIKLIIIGSLLTIISLIIMFFSCNIVTIIIFNICSKISWELIYLVNMTSQGNLSNLSEVKDKYKVEFYQIFELSLFIGRFISFSLFILMSFVSVEILLPVFILFLILLMLNSIKLQKHIWKNEKM